MVNASGIYQWVALLGSISGIFFHTKQDDYLDCYGDPAVTGKVGTDIEDAKCSWLLVQALQRVDPEQMNVLKVNQCCLPCVNLSCVASVVKLCYDTKLKLLV